MRSRQECRRMPTEPTEPLDVQTIRQLVRLMKRYDLTAIDFSDGPTKIRLRRRGAEAVPVGQLRRIGPGARRRPDRRPRRVAGRPPQPPRPRPPPGVVIESPMVGTYLSSSSPDVPPFVSVGSVVRPDTTVCVIEAMKVFTDIPAGVSRHDRRDPGQERPAGRVRPAPVPRQPGLSQDD